MNTQTNKIIYVIGGLAVLGIVGFVLMKFMPSAPASPAGGPSAVTPPPENYPLGRCVPAGCSGQICAEESEAGNIITTCDYRPEYACYREARCERQSNGLCGWTETPGLRACLNNSGSVPL